MTMLEHAARAAWLKAQEGAPSHELVGWEVAPAEAKENFHKCIRGALEDLRGWNTSAAVLRVSHKTGVASSTVDLCFTRMIDAILAEKPE